MTPAFGALAPSRFQERMRRAGHSLPTNEFGRKVASLLLGPAGGRSGRAFDVAVFGSQKARLHPYDNICEKRVYLTPQLWDRDERAFLGDVVSNFSGRVFWFVDVGANAGLYTLFMRAEAQRANAILRAVCVEADPEMAARLRFNLGASGAVDGASVFECAASDRDGALRFAVDRRSRGLSHVDPAGDLEVPARTLLSIIREAAAPRIDALKIDVEGHEFAVLAAFLKGAPLSLHPRLVILEISHAGAAQDAARALVDSGYASRFRTKRNAVLVRTDQTPE